MASIFSKIIAGEIPSYTLAQTEDFIAFLDAFPLKEGHVLVVPKKEVDKLFDLEPALYSGLMAFSQKVAKAMEEVIPCKRIGMAVIGLEVPHAHVHLIPLDSVEDINFTNPKIVLSQEQFLAVQNKIKKALS